ncbi:MAG: DUF805 domain-containing protein [Bifidobacteriaceae bacterium]|nr:DUF805 domain-containing protein [Bifidobacteriaceae bacterium]
MSYVDPMAPARQEPPLDQPYYGASMWTAVKRFFRKYVTFTGRASRSEFWWWMLFDTMVRLAFVAMLSGWYARLIKAFIKTFKALQETIDTGGKLARFPLTEQELRALWPNGLEIAAMVLLMVWGLVILIPYIALSWRRLHDSDFSGAFFLLNLAGLGIVPLIMCMLPPKPEGARYDLVPPQFNYPGGYGTGAWSTTNQSPGYGGPAPYSPYAYPPTQPPAQPGPDQNGYPPYPG